MVVMPVRGGPTRSGAARGGVAGARERFADGRTPHPGEVRPAIAASWARSQGYGVPVTPRVDLPYHAELDLQAPLVQLARPILAELADQLATEPVSVILTDPHGVVLVREGRATRLLRHLDHVQLAPGFSYAEQHVGTNGIGTAVEMGGAALVMGHEHYVEHLEQLSCAGVPIRHPMSGAVLGVLDLTTWSDQPGTMLLALAAATAQRIESELRAHLTRRQQTLLEEYLRSCQHTKGGVVAVDADMVIMNSYLRGHVNPADQAALLARCADAVGAGDPMTLIAQLPSGAVARVAYRPLDAQQGSPSGIVHIQMHEPSAAERPTPLAPRHELPGLVGSDLNWRRACRDVESCYLRGDWVAVRGEAGVGKLAVLRAIHRRNDPAGRLRILDAEDAEDTERWLDALVDELESGRGMLVLRHVDRLTTSALESLHDVLQDDGEHVGTGTRPWVAITVDSDAVEREPLAQVLFHFPHTVEIPPLRHRLDDLPVLVDHLLAEEARGHRLTISAPALRQLKRLPWPGNVAGLRAVLHTIAAQHRSGTVGVSDLPPECFAVTRRQLTHLEAIERDAIVQSLISHGGNRERAAADLGLSRATLYRKIRDYGITAVPSG